MISALRERKGGLARAFLVTEKKGEEHCGCHGNLGVLWTLFNAYLMDVVQAAFSVAKLMGSQR